MGFIEFQHFGTGSGMLIDLAFFACCLREITLRTATMAQKLYTRKPEPCQKEGVKWRFGGPPNYTLANLLLL